MPRLSGELKVMLGGVCAELRGSLEKLVGWGGGQPPDLDPRGTSRTSKLALVSSGVRAVCAFSPNPNTCLSALALSGLHTTRPPRPRVDACYVPGLGRPWRACGLAREGILPWAHSISTARLSWAGGFSEARGEAPEVGMSRGSGGKGGSGRVCLLWALRSDPLLQGRHWGSGWGHELCR